jgi:hypothetical protein
VAARTPIRRADVEEALRLKSFDYRVLSLVLFAVRGVAVDERLMAFLEASEVRACAPPTHAPT